MATVYFDGVNDYVVPGVAHSATLVFATKIRFKSLDASPQGIFKRSTNVVLQAEGAASAPWPLKLIASDIANVVHYNSNVGLNLATDTDYAIFLKLTSTLVYLEINGTALVNETVDLSGSSWRLLNGGIFGYSGGSHADVECEFAWIKSGGVADQSYSDFFDVSDNYVGVTATVQSDTATFFEDGNAAAWNAEGGMVGAVTDVGGSGTLNLPLLNSAETLYPPTLGASGAQAMALPFLDAPTVLYPPNLGSGTTVGNQSELLAALGGASPGDLIILESGNYGSVTLSNTYASDVTLQAQTQYGPVFDRLTLDGASHIVFDGIHVNVTSDASPCLPVSGSDHIQFLNCQINGADAAQFVLRFNNSSTDCTVDNCYIHHGRNMVTIWGGLRMTVQDCTIDYSREDTFKLDGSDLSFIDNIHLGQHTQFASQHDDFAQFSNDSDPGAVNNNITFRGNVYILKSSTPTSTQGFQIKIAGAVTNMLIEQNIFTNHNSNFVNFDTAFGGTYTGNIVRNNTFFRLHDSVTGATVGGNAVEDNIIVNDNVTPGIDANGNLILTRLNLASPYHPSAVFQGVPAQTVYNEGDVDVEDFLPVVGGPAESKGAYLRVLELTSGTGGADLISMPFLSSTGTLYAPAISNGLVLPLLDEGDIFYEITLASGATVVLPFIASAETMSPPLVDLGTVPTAPGLLRRGVSNALLNILRAKT